MTTSKNGIDSNVMLFLRVVIGFNVLLLLYLLGKIMFPEIDFFRANIFFCQSDRFMDFFNPLGYSLHLNPYSNQFGNNPPLVYVISYILASLLKVLTGSENFYQIRYASAGWIVYVLFVIFTILVFCWALKKTLKSSITADFVICCLLLCTSYPFLWVLDRGNFVMLAAVLIGIFIVYYSSGQYWVAAIILGIAAALKIYPAILGVVFLADKKYKEAVVCACTGIFLTLLSFAVFEGGMVSNILIFLDKSSRYSELGSEVPVQILSYNNSLYMLFDIPLVFITKQYGIDPTLLAEINGPIKIAAILLLILIIVLCFFIKQTHDRFLLLCSAILLFPFGSGDYNLTIMIIPIIFWLTTEKTSRYYIAIVGALLISCKGFLALYNLEEYCSISIQSLLNPILLCMIIVYLIVIRKKEIFAYKCHKI